ncbi:MAG: YbjN domain-containing protein [Rhodobacteraceae bacterium]|nr:YbjN domain-containing protein [Paracoccaceae bacterium]
MPLSRQYPETDDIHLIDIVKMISARHDWDFDHVADDRIVMAIEGQWRTYSVTLAWSASDEMLRMICTFDMNPPARSLPKLYEVLNLANDACWAGTFSYWQAQKLMVYRYGLVLAGEQMASARQITRIIEMAILVAERYYPAFQLACWGNSTAKEAVQVAIAEGYGHA